MHARAALAVMLLILSCMVACSSSSADRLHVGREPSVGNGAGGARAQADAGAAGKGQAGRAAVGDDSALTVHVEEPSGLQIEVVTVSCAGDCADVIAVAHGGNAPYAFSWNDGSTEVMRSVCPDATTAYRIEVTDTAIDADEFNYEAHTSSAELTANVLDCSDAGVAKDAGTDGGTGTGLCIDNPSFEGSVTPTQFEAFDAPPWNACYTGGLTYSAIADPTLWPTQNWTFPVAADGATYLALGQQVVFAGRASQLLCEPIAAGTQRSFRVDLARGVSDVESSNPVVQVLGGSAACSEEDVLWTSPVLTPEWTTYCVTIQPQRDMASLGFRAFAADGGLMEGLVDHIVPVESCP